LAGIEPTPPAPVEQGMRPSPTRLGGTCMQIFQENSSTMSVQENNNFVIVLNLISDRITRNDPCISQLHFYFFYFGRKIENVNITTSNLNNKADLSYLFVSGSSTSLSTLSPTLNKLGQST
jgi:hypothetical protein